MIRSLFAVALVSLFTAFSFASNDSGYVIRYGEFSLTVRFVVNDELKKSEDIVRADRAFWDMLSWVYINKDILAESRADVIIWLYGQQRALMELHTGTTGSPGRAYEFMYASGDTGHSLIGFLSLFFKGTFCADAKQNVMISVYKLSVYYKHYDQLNWIAGTFLYSDIFYGSIPSYMINENRNEYFILFWDMKAAVNFIRDQKLKNYELHTMVITKNNIRSVFGEL